MEVELRAHAIANGYFVGGVNRVGTELESDYYGSSLFIDPIGQVLSQAGDNDEEVLVSDLDLGRLEEVARVALLPRPASGQLRAAHAAVKSTTGSTSLPLTAGPRAPHSLNIFVAFVS